MSPPRKRVASGRKSRARPSRPPARPRARAAARAAKPASRARAARRAAAPRLVVVRGRRPKPTPVPRAFRQREGASPKQLLLFELVRERAHLLATLQGLSAPAAEAPAGHGGWSPREIVLHLHAWDLELERALEPAFRGTSPAWMRLRGRGLDRFNAERLAPLRDLPWEEALRRLQTGRERLLEAVESLPDEPAALWSKRHPLGRMLAILPDHDRHHAESIKTFREAAGSLSGASPGTRAPQPRTKK